MNVYSVILAGGSGTRFWPLSRTARPKQFLSLATRAPLLVDTVRRISRFSTLKRTFVSCGPVHAPAVRKLIKGLPGSNVLVEPVARNTAAAIGLAAVHALAREPQPLLQVLPADHAVRDLEGFSACLDSAAHAARRGLLVTLGIRPTRPETATATSRSATRSDRRAFASGHSLKSPMPTPLRTTSSPGGSCGTRGFSSSAQTTS